MQQAATRNQIPDILMEGFKQAECILSEESDTNKENFVPYRDPLRPFYFALKNVAYTYDLTTKIYQCLNCKKNVKCFDSVINHINTHSNSRPYKCSECDAAYTTRQRQTSHQSKKHLKRTNIIKCQNFNSSNALKNTKKQSDAFLNHCNHQRNSKAVTNFFCPICALKFQKPKSRSKSI